METEFTGIVGPVSFRTQGPAQGERNVKYKIFGMISGDSTGCKMTYSDPANASWAWNGVRVPALWN